MKYTSLTMSIFSLLLAGSAMAADLPVTKGPPPAPEVYAPIFSWTGFYAGLDGGFNMLSTRDVIPAYPSSFTINSNAFAVGGKVGYNYQLPSNIVLGLEAGGTFVFNNSSNATGVLGETYQVKQDFQGDIVARLGYSFGQFLPYLKGGVAFAHLKDLRYNTFPGSRSATFTGWTIGAGVDYALSNNWIVGLDYAYAAYPKKTFLYGGFNTLRPSTNTVLATISYKF